MKRNKNAAKKLKMEAEAEEAQPSREEKPKKPAKEAKKSAKDGKKKAKSPERPAEEVPTSRESRKKEKEKGRKQQRSVSPTPGTSQVTPPKPKKKAPQHLARPRTPSPEAYDTDDDSDMVESPETTVVREEVEEPPVAIKGKGSSGGRPKKKWRKLTQHEEDVLVQYYLENPIFYDKSHDDFLNRELKKRMRDEKGAEMKLDGTYIDPM